MFRAFLSQRCQNKEILQYKETEQRTETWTPEMKVVIILHVMTIGSLKGRDYTM